LPYGRGHDHPAQRLGRNAATARAAGCEQDQQHGSGSTPGGSAYDESKHRAGHLMVSHSDIDIGAGKAHG
jgi:hypothetical protein